MFLPPNSCTIGMQQSIYHSGIRALNPIKIAKFLTWPSIADNASLADSVLS